MDSIGASTGKLPWRAPEHELAIRAAGSHTNQTERLRIFKEIAPLSENEEKSNSFDLRSREPVRLSKKDEETYIAKKTLLPGHIRLSPEALVRRLEASIRKSPSNSYALSEKPLPEKEQIAIQAEAAAILGQL